MTFDRPEHPGTPKVMAQRYEILRQLREEPWGEVWLAQDNILRVEVGLKLFPREAPGWDPAQEIFRQEAILALRLRHPQILGVFLFGQTETGLYLVQEPFAGESLLAHFARHTRFSLPQALHLLEEISAALSSAHEQQVAHRSLNPLNILLEGEKVRVANFTWPPVENEQALHLELKAYNPPEVILGDQVTPAGNVFSLGVLGFRLVAGSLPYPLTFDEPFPYRLETPPVDLEEIPFSLQNLLLQCLAVEPEERFMDAGQFLTQLRHIRERWGPGPRDQWAGWEPQGLRPPWLDQAAAHGAKIWSAGKSFTQNWGKKVWEELPNYRAKIFEAPRRLWWGLGLAGLLILLVLVGNKIRQRPAPPPAPPVAATPLKLPFVGGGPPMVETQEPAPALDNEPTETSAAAPPQTAAPPSRAVAKPAPKQERYLIVAASYAKEDQARNLDRRLRAKHYNSQVVKKVSGRKTLFLVQLGPLASSRQAEEIARRLKAQEKIAPKVQKVAIDRADTPPSRRAQR